MKNHLTYLLISLLIWPGITLAKMGEIDILHLTGPAHIERYEYLGTFNIGTGGKIYLGDRFTTEDNTYATLWFDDGSYLYLYPNSQIYIERLHKDLDIGLKTEDTVLRLEKGQAWVDSRTNPHPLIKFGITSKGGVKVFGKGAHFFIRLNENTQQSDGLLGELTQTDTPKTVLQETTVAVESGQVVVLNNRGKTALDPGLAINVTGESNLNDVIEMLPEPELVDDPYVVWKRDREVTQYKLNVFKINAQEQPLWVDAVDLENQHSFDPNIYPEGDYQFQLAGWDTQTQVPTLDISLERHVYPPLPAPQLHQKGLDVFWKPILGKKHYQIEVLSRDKRHVYKRFTTFLPKVTADQLPYGPISLRVYAVNFYKTPAHSAYLDYEKRAEVKVKQLPYDKHWLSEQIQQPIYYEDAANYEKTDFGLVEISWPNQDYENQYHLEISRDSTFKDLAVDIWLNKHLAHILLTKNKDYWVRVTYGPDLKAAYSYVKQFHLEDKRPVDIIPEPLIR